MTSTTSYQRRNGTGEISSLLFGMLEATAEEIVQIHGFFAEHMPEYLAGATYVVSYRESLAAPNAGTYEVGAVYDLLSSEGMEENAELAIRLTQGKNESLEGNQHHYRIRLTIKGPRVTQELSDEVDKKVKTLESVLFGTETAKREEFFASYAQ